MSELKVQLTGILNARDEAYGKEQRLSQEEEVAFKAASAKLKDELAKTLQVHEAQAQEQRKKLEAKWKRRTDRIEAAYIRVKSKIDARSSTVRANAKKKQQQAHEKATKEYEAQSDAFQYQCKMEFERLEALLATGEDLKRRIAGFAHDQGLSLNSKKAPPFVPSQSAAMPDAIEESLKAITDRFETERMRMVKRMSPVILFSIAALLHIAGFAVLYSQMPNSPYIFGVFASMIIAFAAIQAWNSKAKDQACAVAVELWHMVSELCILTESQKGPVDEKQTQGLAELEGARIQRFCAVDEEVNKLINDNNKSSADAIKGLRARRDQIQARVKAAQQAALDEYTRQSEKAAAKLQAELAEKQKQFTTKHTNKVRDVDQEKTSAIARLSAEWDKALADLKSFSAAELKNIRATNPVWTEASGKNWKLPAGFGEDVFTGTAHADLRRLVPEAELEGKFSIPDGATVALPLLLNYPMLGSFFVRAGAQKREEAMQTLFSSVLRLLSSFPATKAKLTIIDPIGLGQNFGGLMHLCDYDESVVGGKIWSDIAHIEKKLTDLTEHMEKIIQKYLRNKYESISDFNREAGQMAEPYRFLVIADFPNGFTELALERLASIIASGVRCGVYTLILNDDRGRIPPPLSEMHIRRNGLFITEHDGGFVLDDDVIKRAKVELDAPPAAPVVDALIHAIGTQCQEAARVQVPFEAVTPKANEFWTSSTEAGIRLPLGKAGADRLQYMHLGKGTAQHALIAGKTGSGKSNLFHVIVTNAAMWYHPREVEFYLIDFKKGVEFKTYGVHALPHARVVAIESDREFGLSVLKRIDRELTARGELFRKARVQDFPSYRKAEPNTLLPRSLLVIDEFQEFFTDDDAVAQEAALLLDRVVRQGRAFGIHVILGTQTLGGTYSLSKSTLGQVAVRIALQCNEADSYMILSDDNAAAALLSRPGEAIYNDMAGLVEGNNPFQAVFLPKEDQDKFLSVIQKRAATEKVQTEAPAVFEGNSLADLRNNHALVATASRPPKPVDGARVWLGEANAIKGPTEVVFDRQAGNNLLIVGQRGEPELSMCIGTVLSLAAGNAPDDVRIIILDGTTPDSGTRDRLSLITDVLPHNIDVVEARRVPQVLEELGNLIKGRQDGSDETTARVYMLVLGLDRFRNLRQDDEFGFGSSSDEGASPSKRFTEVLTEGPNQGVHTIIWCDTLTNLNRTISRKTLREFEMRVLFQMSANDSSELIDTPAANRLGLYNALLFTAQNGATEKFRPYMFPDGDLVADFSKALHARSASRSGDRTAAAGE
jgi:S-DNA-T family DNA segregation ATPase FtsK/SpoIIIE